MHVTEYMLFCKELWAAQLNATSEWATVINDLLRVCILKSAFLSEVPILYTEERRAASFE